MKSSLIITLLFLLFNLPANAQRKSVSGIVIDKASKEPLSYASVHIPNTLNGTITNDAGEFDLKLDKGRDSIIVSYIGYEDQVVVISKSKLPLKIKMGSRAVQLEEIIVRSLSPLEYLRKAIDKYPGTIDPNSFEARGFFLEKSSMANDNSGAYQLNEAVFKTYFKSFGDTSSQAIQNQLVLFRQKNEGEFRSMLLDNKKIKKRLEKERKKETGEKGKITDEEMEEEMDIDIDGITGGGPEQVLADAQSLLELAFLEPNNFKKMRYSFGQNSFYKNRDLIVIDFISKRKIEMAKYIGSVYLDYEDLAIVAVKYKATYKIPFLINVLIKSFIGISIDNVTQEATIKNQVKDNYWYPKEVIKDISITLVQEKEPEVIRTKQLYSIDQIMTTGVLPLNKEFLFDPKLEYETQVHNQEGLKWDQVNIVK